MLLDWTKTRWMLSHPMEASIAEMATSIYARLLQRSPSLEALWQSIFAGLHNTSKWRLLSLKCQVWIYQLIFGMLRNPDNRLKRLNVPSKQTTRWRAFKAYIPREIFTFLSDGSIEMHCPIPQEHLQRMPRTTSLALHWTLDKWNSRTECQINATPVWTLG